jgi:hypothetical protein
MKFYILSSLNDAEILGPCFLTVIWEFDLLTNEFV